MPPLPETTPTHVRKAHLTALLHQLQPDETDATTLTDAQLLDACRCAFLLASDNQSQLQAGLRAAAAYTNRQRDAALALAYQGAFQCVQASYLMWPLQQFQAVRQGLANLDKSLKAGLVFENTLLMAMILDKLPPMFPERAKLRAMRTAANNRLPETQHLPDWFVLEARMFLGV